MSTKLTEIQEAILAYMVQHQNEHSRPPSLREICEEFGYASSNAARKHVQALARKGLVIDTGDRRTWAAKVKEVQEHLFTIPVYGTIPAGLPAENSEQADETVRIDPTTYRLRSARGLFALHVRGDSMIDAQIADGDIALLRQDEPRPGQIVAALIDGASTLKRLVREGRRTFLRAENKRFRDLIPAESLTIQGVVVGVIGRGKR
jgi:repressor LexA